MAGTSLVVIDGVTEALALFDLKLESSTDQAEFLKLLARRLAEVGPAVLHVDNVIKDKDRRGRYAIGSQHKLAGTDVTYMLEAIAPFGRGLSGKSKLTVSKDRPGFIRAASAKGKIVGEVRFESDPETGAMSVEIERTSDGERFRPTALMERVSRHLETIEERPSARQILTDVTGSSDYLKTALAVLIEEGYVGWELGERRSHSHYSIKPFRE